MAITLAVMVLSAMWAFADPPLASPTLEPVEPAEHPRSYMRVARDGLGGESVTLELAVRRFVPREGDGHGPVIWLVSAVHVGKPEYYAALQRFLNDQPLVLYEGVGRPPFMDPDEANDDARAARTDSAVEFTSRLIDWYRVRFGGPPLSLAVLRQAVKEHRPREVKPLRHAVTDAWGRPLQYRRIGHTYELRSLGANGQPGGTGAAADIAHEGDADATPADEADAISSIQDSLARALGLVFQLDGIDYDHDHFVNSDLSLRQLEAHVAAEGAGRQELSSLLSAMDGSSLLASVARFGLKLIEVNPRLRAMVRVVLIELLGQLEGDISRMQGMPPNMQRLMTLIIHDRNEVVTGDLRRILAAEVSPASIAVFYGAGHMHDLELRVTEELGYKPVQQFWLPAFAADTREAGLSPAEAGAMRRMIQAQLRQAKPVHQRPSGTP